MSDHKNAPDPPKQGPLSKIEMRHKISTELHMIFQHHDHNCTVQELDINQLEKLFTTYTNSVLDEAIGKKELYELSRDYSSPSALIKSQKGEYAVPVAALEALRKRLG